MRGNRLLCLFYLPSRNSEKAYLPHLERIGTRVRSSRSRTLAAIFATLEITSDVGQWGDFGERMRPDTSSVYVCVCV